jgi:hypothetical protein
MGGGSNILEIASRYAWAKSKMKYPKLVGAEEFQDTDQCGENRLQSVLLDNLAGELDMESECSVPWIENACCQ